MPAFEKAAILARMVKIEHSVFALPFAYLGAFLVAGGWPGWRPLLLLTVAMVAVRSFAMAFNRLVDVRYDSLNPRTRSRPLVSGEIGKKETVLFIAVCALVFVGSCALMNTVCLLLSPVALAISAFYSYVKRFSWLCHFVLGLVLALAPVAGRLSVEPGFGIPLALFFLGVLFWVAGFDIIYSCQDVAFDNAHGLHSLPAVLGIAPALHISFFCHVNTSLFFLLAGWAAGLSWPYYLVWALVSLILLLEHKIISAKDMSRVNLAFFTFNGVISIAVFAGVCLGLQG